MHSHSTDIDDEAPFSFTGTPSSFILRLTIIPNSRLYPPSPLPLLPRTSRRIRRVLSPRRWLPRRTVKLTSYYISSRSRRPASTSRFPLCRASARLISLTLIPKSRLPGRFYIHRDSPSSIISFERALNDGASFAPKQSRDAEMIP